MNLPRDDWRRNDEALQAWLRERDHATPPASPGRLGWIRRWGGLVKALWRGCPGPRWQEERDIAVIAVSGCFDGSFYLSRYPDVLQAGLDPLQHYVRSGAREGRQPHPQFDGEYYQLRMPSLLRDGGNPLAHFLRHGQAAPNPWVDLAEWRQKHPQSDRPDILYLLAGRGREQVATPLDRGLTAEQQARLEAIRAAYDFESQASSWQGLEAAIDRIAALAQPVAEPKVSIVIPVHGQIRHSLACIESILTWPSRHSFEILVGDDGSLDDTAEILARLPGLRVLSASQARGFLRNCNETAAVAQGAFLVLLNNDTLVLPGWLDALIDSFAMHPQAGLVGSKLLYPDGRLQEAGCVVWADGRGTNVGRLGDASLPAYNHLRAVDYCSAAAIALPMALWRELGGFDERYAPAYYEDTDLAFRVRDSGYRVLYQPQAQVIHFEGVSCGTEETGGTKRFQAIHREVFRQCWASVLERFGTPEEGLTAAMERGCQGRLLVIDGAIPTPDRDSGSADMLNYLRLLRRQGWHVLFLPADLAYVAGYNEQLEAEGIECLGRPYLQSLEAAVAAFAPVVSAAMVCRVDIARRVLPRLRSAAPGLPVIFHTVDLHHLREEREAVLADSKALMERAAETKRQEIACMQMADVTTVVSNHELAVAQGLAPQAKLRQLPLVRRFPDGPFPDFGQRDGVLFLGLYRHRPNQDAISYLLREVWPKVMAQVPALTLLLAGTGIPPELERGNPGVRVLGHVPDLQGLFARCRISVAPLRFGAGLKGKVVDSLGHGVPLVGTAMAVEGSGFEDGEHVLLGDDAEALARQIIRLHGDQGLWTRLAAQGQAQCRALYGAEAVSAHLAAVLRDVGI